MSAVSYKCPNCGGELTFDPQTQKYKCEYCFSYFTEEELEAANPDVKSAGEDGGTAAPESEAASGAAGNQEAAGKDRPCSSAPRPWYGRETPSNRHLESVPSDTH